MAGAGLRRTWYGRAVLVVLLAAFGVSNAVAFTEAPESVVLCAVIPLCAAMLLARPLPLFVAPTVVAAAAARSVGPLSPELSTPFFEALALLARRAQQARLLRADLVPDDLHRIMAMVTGVLGSMDPATEGWRRYLGILLDGLSPAARPSSRRPCPTTPGWPLLSSAQDVAQWRIQR
ncbi:hypothetical protein [Actinoplanes sp. ATCC 53533]|uniref:hypothetical protein n=1 Tax=Actinoplanes sp. ATCC 53533 TaxID=1288362 RepID=UPI000F7B3BE1|nr:hypothetical protein [Actinoplanes sp. ATCC 53533]